MRDLEKGPARLRAPSLRARLAGVLLLASLPGVVLGGIEAHRAYVTASQAEREGVTLAARQTANRVEEVVSGALILAESLAQAPPVRIGAVSCEAILASAASQSQRFALIARLDRNGRVLCSSDAELAGSDWSEAPWFAQASRLARPAVAASWGPGGSAEQTIPLTAPILNRDRATGLVVVLLRGVWLITRAAEDLEDETASIVVFDAGGAPFAAAPRAISQQDAIVAARRALAGAHGDFGALQTGVATIPGGGMRIVVVAPSESGAFGYRAALITAAPLIAVALAMAAVWIALHWWVVRWIDGLVASAKSASAGQYEPIDLHGAPHELRVLAEAFDDAVTRLGAQLSRNARLARELHHRVKNNIQVFMSALSRQLRRTDEPTARYALSVARARLLPVALTYRYAAGPDDVALIELSEYLAEIARQIHGLLDGAGRGVELCIECEPAQASHDEAAAIGMMVGECLTSAYAASTGMSHAAIALKLRHGATEGVTLECGVLRVNPSHDAAKMDEALIGQLARQIGAQATIELGPRFSLRWRAPAPARAAAPELTPPDR